MKITLELNGYVDVIMAQELLNNMAGKICPPDHMATEMDMNIISMFSTRTFNTLRKLGVVTLGDITKLTKWDILKQRQCGRKTIAEIEDVLSDFGLALMNISNRGIMIRFFVPGIPVPKGSAKAFINRKTGRAIVTQTNGDKQKPWASAIGYSAAQVCSGIYSGPVSLTLNFYMPRPKAHYTTKGIRTSAPYHHTNKPDLDKLIRCVKDSLTGVVWKDDSQVFSVTAHKVYSDQPGVDITVEGMEWV